MAADNSFAGGSSLAAGGSSVVGSSLVVGAAGMEESFACYSFGISVARACCRQEPLM